MNKTAELVCVWSDYEETHPGASLEDFFRYSLLKQRGVQPEENLVGGVVPREIDPLLMKLIGRIFKLFEIYMDSAVKEAGLKQIEEFILLGNINFGMPRKTEVIYASLIELSTGSNILNKLKEEQFLVEYDDEDDKRSKRLKLTPKGEKALLESRKKMGQVAKVFFNDMTDDDKHLCVQLLKGVEIKFSGLWQQHKGKSFPLIYEDLVQNSK
jgi:DNA-binding MarR family transcriptional regulator